jgi:DNA polymerase elongation subunit (family B)
MFNFRKEFKAKASAAVKGSAEQFQFFCLEKSAKLVLNTLYGMLGESISPLYSKLFAGSVTAYGRRAIQAAERIMIDKGHSIMGIDTDSCFA